jgi:hypothetical protein
MVRAEVPALSRAVLQDGIELNSMENLKRTNTNKLYFSLLVKGEKMLYMLRGKNRVRRQFPIFCAFFLDR